MQRRRRYRTDDWILDRLDLGLFLPPLMSAIIALSVHANARCLTPDYRKQGSKPAPARRLELHDTTEGPRRPAPFVTLRV